MKAAATSVTSGSPCADGILTDRSPSERRRARSARTDIEPEMLDDIRTAAYPAITAAKTRIASSMGRSCAVLTNIRADIAKAFKNASPAPMPAASVILYFKRMRLASTPDRIRTSTAANEIRALNPR